MVCLECRTAVGSCRRPALRSWLLLGEQALRIALVLLLVPRLQWLGLWLAYLIPLALRVLAGWSLAGRYAAGPHFYFWQTFVAPVGAALILYALLHGLVAVMGELSGRRCWPFVGLVVPGLPLLRRFDGSSRLLE
jgi:O-antigen/teichoic acid export membrane protein